MKTVFRNTALALAAAGLAVPAIPAAAADFGFPGASRAVPVEESWENRRDRDRYGDRYRGRDRDRYDDRRYGDRYDDRRYRDRYDDRRGYRQAPTRTYYAEPVYRDTRTWRGNDGRNYCRKRDGTTGLIVGAAAGALVGREIDKHGDRTLGTVLGAAAGALLGKKVAQGTSCR